MPRASNRKRARKRARQEKEQNELPTIYPHNHFATKVKLFMKTGNVNGIALVDL